MNLTFFLLIVLLIGLIDKDVGGGTLFGGLIAYLLRYEHVRIQKY